MFRLGSHEAFNRLRVLLLKVQSHTHIAGDITQESQTPSIRVFVLFGKECRQTQMANEQVKSSPDRGSG